MNATAQDDTANYEVIVIGAGISGLGVARACQSAGYHTAVVDRGEIGAATSANSLRIIHGGFRYLQSLDIPRVIRSLRDQARVQREFPDLVRPLPCYLPLVRYGLKSRWPLLAASWLYRMLGVVCGVRAPETRVLSRAAAEQALPLLAGHVDQGAFLWHDLQLIDPAALHQGIAQQIRMKGGAVMSGTEACEIERVSAGFRVRLRCGAEEKTISSRMVVNAAGPWVQTLNLRGESSAVTDVGWCRGFNLVFEGNSFGTFGAGLSGEQGRLYFFVGRDGETAVGTDYLPFQHQGGSATVSEADVADFIQRVSQVAPELSLDRQYLKRVELGVLPLKDRSAHPEQGLIGSARISHSEGFVTLLSTKYTTFLSQADRVLRIVTAHLSKSNGSF